MHTRHARAALVALLALLSPLPALAQDAAPPAKAKAPTGSDYIRVRDVDDGSKALLQVSIRSFTKEGAPTVHLVGVVHVGDKAYYANLQHFLDEQDLVLFEGVKPGAAVSDLANADDAAKVKVTKSRQRLLAILVYRYLDKNKKLPDTLDESFSGLHGAMARLGKAATVDAWGHPQAFERKKVDGLEKYDIISLGADNAPDGEGANADVRLSSQKPLTKDEKSGGGEGIQVQLANALGLEFQLAAIDYNRAKWRNSDMTIDELEDKMKEAGLSGGALFSMLDGSSMMSKFVGFALGMIAKSPEMSFYFKVMMVETIAHADEMMDSQSKAMGQGMAEFMKILVIDRNAVVFSDLEAALRDEPTLKSIALFYGAGHLPDMEARLGDMGFSYAGSIWKDAVEVDASAIPGGKALMKNIRAQVNSMLPK